MTIYLGHKSYRDRVICLSLVIQKSCGNSSQSLAEKTDNYYWSVFKKSQFGGLTVVVCLKRS